MNVTVYHDPERLSPGCLRLLQDAGAASFYHSVEWYRNLVRHALDEGDTVRFYALEPPDRSGEAAALLAMRAPRRAGRVTEPRRLLSLSNYYSSLYGPAVADFGHDQGRSLRTLLGAVCAESPAWDLIQLHPLAPESTLFPHLVDGLRECGMFVQPYFCFGNWYLEVDGRTYPQYLAGLPSVLRNTLSRKGKKLRSSGRATLRIVTGGRDLESAIADYEHVYASSWKVPEPHPRFMPGLIRTCAEMGWLRLGLLHVDGEPAAVQVWIVHGGTASIYKLAYQEKFADLSVGSLLTTHLMEHALDVDKVSTVDYMTGDDSYKKDWMSHRRERWGILALNRRTVKGLAGIARHAGGRLLRRALGRAAGPAQPAAGPGT